MIELKSVILLVLFICVNVIPCFAQTQNSAENDTCNSHTTVEQLENLIPKS